AVTPAPDTDQWLQVEIAGTYSNTWLLASAAEGEADDSGNDQYRGAPHGFLRSIEPDISPDIASKPRLDQAAIVAGAATLPLPGGNPCAPSRPSLFVHAQTSRARAVASTPLAACSRGSR